MANVLMSVAEFLRRNMRYCTILSVPTVNNLQYIPMSLGYHMSLSVSFLPSICTQMVLCNKNWSQNLFTVVEQRMFFFCPPHLYTHIFYSVAEPSPPFWQLRLRFCVDGSGFGSGYCCKSKSSHIPVTILCRSFKHVKIVS